MFFELPPSAHSVWGLENFFEMHPTQKLETISSLMKLKKELSFSPSLSVSAFPPLSLSLFSLSSTKYRTNTSLSLSFWSLFPSSHSHTHLLSLSSMPSSFIYSLPLFHHYVFHFLSLSHTFSHHYLSLFHILTPYLCLSRCSLFPSFLCVLLNGLTLPPVF